MNIYIPQISQKPSCVNGFIAKRKIVPFEFPPGDEVNFIL